MLMLTAAPGLAADARKAPPPPASVDPDEAKARALFTEAQKAYDVGQFPQALELYTQAYKLKPLPGFLFNIAQCQRQMSNYKEAAFTFGRFIDLSKPEAPNVGLARELVDDMHRRQAEREKAAAVTAVRTDTPVMTDLSPAPLLAPPPAPPLEAEPPVYKKGWFWGAVGGGVVVVGGAILASVLLSQPKTVPATTGTLGEVSWR
jgi:tetratricopeptide (TPR) repeat protein